MYLPILINCSQTKLKYNVPFIQFKISKTNKRWRHIPPSNVQIRNCFICSIVQHFNSSSDPLFQNNTPQKPWKLKYKSPPTRSLQTINKKKFFKTLLRRFSNSSNSLISICDVGPCLTKNTCPSQRIESSISSCRSVRNPWCKQNVFSSRQRHRDDSVDDSSKSSYGIIGQKNRWPNSENCDGAGPGHGGRKVGLREREMGPHRAVGEWITGHFFPRPNYTFALNINIRYTCARAAYTKSAINNSVVVICDLARRENFMNGQANCWIFEHFS